jgi:hypothetical protein
VIITSIPSFLQEDADWTYEDVQNSLAKVNMLNFPFEAKFPHNENGEINVDWNNCQPSAEHHLNEFKSIESKLVSGTIIAIDDNIMLHSKRYGKGRNIFNYLESKNILPIYDKYMIIYIWR